MYPGFDGGAEWGGAAWDPTTGLLYVNANEVGGMLRMMERPSGFNPRTLYLDKCGVCHGPELAGTGAGPSLRGIAERRTPVEILTAIALGGGRMPSFIDIPLPILERLAVYVANPNDAEAALAALDARPGSDSPYVTAGYVYLRDEQGIPLTRPPFAAPRWRLGAAAAPPQGTLGGSGQLDAPRGRDNVAACPAIALGARRALSPRCLWPPTQATTCSASTTRPPSCAGRSRRPASSPSGTWACA